MQIDLSNKNELLELIGILNSMREDQWRKSKQLNVIIKALQEEVEPTMNEVDYELCSVIMETVANFKANSHKHKLYKVPKGLRGTHIVPISYLQRRLSSSAVVRRTMRTASTAINNAVRDLVLRQKLEYLDKGMLFREYNFKGTAVVLKQFNGKGDIEETQNNFVAPTTEKNTRMPQLFVVSAEGGGGKFLNEGVYVPPPQIDQFQEQTLSTNDVKTTVSKLDDKNTLTNTDVKTTLTNNTPNQVIEVEVEPVPAKKEDRKQPVKKQQCSPIALKRVQEFASEPQGPSPSLADAEIEEHYPFHTLNVGMSFNVPIGTDIDLPVIANRDFVRVVHDEHNLIEIVRVV